MTKTEKIKADRAARRAVVAERERRMEAAREETRAIVARGTCPDCGRKLRRNLSLTGWWQCSQLGAEGFRADPTNPSCDWQGFTE